MPTFPSIIAIDYDNYHAKYVGHTGDGRQFFLTTQFIPPLSQHMRSSEFVALYLFDAEGVLVEARIDDLGSRQSLNEQDRQLLIEQRLGELGEVQYGRIQVRPFQIVRFGTRFGLIVRLSASEPAEWWVNLEPGNSMAFYEPWDSGIYDT